MKRRRRLSRGIVGPLALLLALMLLGIFAATEWLARPAYVAGSSMAPALLPGDRVVVDVWSYRQRAPRVGEIVLFAGPGSPAVPLLKRVAAAPPFPDDRPRPGEWPTVDRTQGPGIWLLGDNPAASDDSRRFGPVPRRSVVGRVVFRYWPVSRAGPIRSSGRTTSPGVDAPPGR